MASDGTLFKITVAGRLSREWQEWLGGMEIEPGEVTVLVGRLQDSAALYGVLNHLAGFNLRLVSVESVGGGEGDANYAAISEGG